MSSVRDDGHVDASPEVVGALLVDEGFLRAYVEELKAQPGQISSTPDGVTVVEWSVSTEKFPSLVRPLLGDRLRVTERTVWSGPPGARSGELTATIAASRPAKLTARIELAAEGSGTAVRARGELKVSVPMIGGKVEQLAAPYLVSGLRARVVLANRWVS